jgi:hypothetical protein
MSNKNIILHAKMYTFIIKIFFTKLNITFFYFDYIFYRIAHKIIVVETNSTNFIKI